MLSLIMLAVLSGGQGEAVLLTVDPEPGLQGVTVVGGGHDVALAPGAAAGPGPAAWLGWIGFDLDAATGRQSLHIHRRYDDGRETQEALILTVEPRTYPETRLDVARRYVDLAPEDQARAGAEAAEIAAIYATVTPGHLWDGPFVVPVDGARDGRNFGHRRFLNGQPRAPHSGADLRASLGQPVLAANRGRVVLAKPLFFSGNAIFLDHGSGVYSVYLHLSEFRARVGDTVNKGEVIGLAGATGRVTGPHLHWGVRVRNARVDPFSLVRESQ